MLVVHHRVNRANDLAAVPRDRGVEVDLRCEGGRLLVRHDATGPAEDFEAWLDAYAHALLIANVKEEGLEPLLLPLLAARGIAEVFLLDQSFPSLVRTLRAGEGRCAVRVSEYEAPSTALRLRALGAQWVWLDCFEGWPRPDADLAALRDAGLRICLVSPELHSPDRAAEIPTFVQRAYALGVEAVCTKRPDAWSRG